MLKLDLDDNLIMYIDTERQCLCYVSSSMDPRYGTWESYKTLVEMPGKLVLEFENGHKRTILI